MILHFLIYLKMFVFKPEYNSLMIIYSLIMHLKIDNTYWISKCCCITLIILLTLIIEYCYSGKYRWCKHPHTKLPKLHVYHLVCADNKCNIVSFFWVLFFTTVVAQFSCKLHLLINQQLNNLCTFGEDSYQWILLIF